MKILLIEDEYLASEKLEAQLLRYDPSIEVLGTIDSIRNAVKWFEANPAPDLAFLDIHLSDGNSFEIFQKVDVKCPIIFTTAYDEYAVKAFKVNSIDYLLKPISNEDLGAAMDKFKALHQSQPAAPVLDMQQIMALISKGSASATVPHYKNRFLVKSGQKIRSVSTDEIAYFYAEDKIVFLITTAGHRFITDYTLDTLQEILDPEQFSRLNRQFISHIHAIDEIHPYLKGRLKVYVKPTIDKEIIISNERAAAFKEWLGK
ncbi:LytR/AlgR family response regulator transcription factor [Rufibacter glacialis]|uniref:Response regulator transcription factor n=1 Tax=Rufibacter glacialis TaxID=1259555 RepID=A0A5M8QQP3_9BACT|nr:LytTR family DNA-binding domain-containing protein [Rufibacter glacialis]KAA6437561.1 response regulator transcription factor [Rufibacter glacialis]GGK58319.1 DNA-binding response regulator [Rufibacter glacialis]